MDVVINGEDFATVAHYLGKVLDARNGKQTLLSGDSSVLEELEIHPCNRNIDLEWVKTLMPVMNKLSVDQESVGTFHVGIVRGDVHMAKVAENGDSSIKGVILDGQHRFLALRELKRLYPLFDFTVYLYVYVVDSDAEIMNRIRDINARREFNQRDTDGLLTRAIWKESMEELLGDRVRHRFVSYIWKDAMLRDPDWLAKVSGKNKETIKNRIKTIGESYASKYEAACKENPRLASSVKGQTIKQTGLYQLYMEKHNWIAEM